MNNLTAKPPRAVRRALWCLAALAIVPLATFAQDSPKKVSKVEAMSAATVKVPPEYPPTAKQLKLEGVVELEAVVSETGTVDDVNIVSGNPVLSRSAATALKRWKFSPFMEGGKPIKVLAPISMTFKM